MAVQRIKAFTANDDSGTYTSLVIDSESDYNLLNADGETVLQIVYFIPISKDLKQV